MGQMSHLHALAITFIVSLEFCQNELQQAYSVPYQMPRYRYQLFSGSGSPSPCTNFRPDCELFRFVCDHPDYKQCEGYMYQCCRNTCDPNCRTTVTRDYRERGNGGRDRRNQEAIRRKYLGDRDYFGQRRDEQQQNRRWWGPMDAGGVPEGTKWRDDDRWDRNDPWELRRKTEV